ncbi:hypothetical protein L915_21943 [Phytophthora nicotianae]|uniref:Uncharacterized protein n=1 Tax=Phytophthora nicotianae TaxID=4792 RepID=W2FIY6_PHYNI|nr:hypothetical protein L915_21943 [Phytophthora nicotianae]
MVRPHAEPTEPAGPTAPSTPKKPSKRQDFIAEGGPKKKRSKTGTTTKKPEAKGTRKTPPKTPSKTKKQQADEATERRRKLSLFTKVWGATNAQVSDGRRVEPPHALPSTEAGATSNADTDDNADGDNASNGDVDDDAVATDGNDNRASDGSASEYEDNPNDAAIEEEEGSEVEDDTQDGDFVVDAPENDEAGEEEDKPEAPLLHPAESDTHFEAIRFADVEPSDPNLVLDDGEKRIESDGEGAEDAAGVEELSDAEDEPDTDLVGSVATETSRVARLLSEVEVERLHMRVEGILKVGDMLT